MVCSTEGDVRLDVNSAMLVSEGSVQACIGQTWRSICDDGWGEEEAKVVCTQLGYSPSGKCVSVWQASDVWHVVVCVACVWCVQVLLL